MSRVRNDAGFSLVEALVALAVFALAGVALVQLQAQSLRTLSAAETRALARIVVQNALVDVVARSTPPDIGAEAGGVHRAAVKHERCFVESQTLMTNEDPL